MICQHFFQDVFEKRALLNLLIIVRLSLCYLFFGCYTKNTILEFIGGRLDIKFQDSKFLIKIWVELPVLSPIPKTMVLLPKEIQYGKNCKNPGKSLPGQALDHNQKSMEMEMEIQLPR
jgi:hypothetical protein